MLKSTFDTLKSFVLFDAKAIFVLLNLSMTLIIKLYINSNNNRKNTVCNKDTKNKLRIQK